MTAPGELPVRVDGGDLAVAESGDRHGPLVLAVHGITASSRAWLALAPLLPEVRLLAPDLRGRGRSRDLPEPYGLRQHAADLARVLDAARAEEAVVVGHSMGAFAALLLAAQDPRVSRLVLVDGGLPLAAPPGADLAALLAADPAALLGPAWERLGRVYPDHASYQAFWRAHPAFAGAFTADVAAYVDYDLVPVEGGFRASAVPEAVAADQRELFGPGWYREALRRVHQSAVVLRAPLGLQAEPPGLYPPGALEAARDLIPQLEVVEVPEVNHYTILMTSPGVERVAGAVRGALPLPRP